MKNIDLLDFLFLITVILHISTLFLFFQMENKNYSVYILYKDNQQIIGYFDNKKECKEIVKEIQNNLKENIVDFFKKNK